MITAIPNQPINFGDSLLDGCLCDSIIPPLLIHSEDDNIIFQLGIDQCPNAESIIDNTDFQGVNWKGGLGWTLFPGRACGAAQALGTLQDDSFSPTVGEWYVITFVVESVRDTVSWSIGGTSGTFGSTGTNTGMFTQTLTFQATSTAELVITLDTSDSAICLNMVAAYQANRDLTVDFISEGGDVLATFDTDVDPQYFTFQDTNVIVNIPMSETGIEECFTIRVTNKCSTDELTLTSQTIKAVSDTDCTLKVRVCNDAFSLGLLPEPLEMRLSAKLVHPKWEYEASGERRSNGRIYNHYVDRQRSMELRIGLQSEWVHPFLAAIPLFGHFYIGQQEFVMDTEPYEPDYADVFDGTASIIRVVRPKQELARKVSCAEELSGCVPPPNLWVQGTGPNEDYIITQANQTIALAN